MTEIFNARTVEEAKAQAAVKFGVPEEMIEFEIIEQPKKGLFGKIKGQARLKASYVPQEEVQNVPADEQEYTEIQTVQTVEEEPVQIPETTETAQPETVKDEISSEINPKAAAARDYVAGILDAMGINSACEVTETEDGATLNFDGDGSGTIIGRRGETLDSLQYLASMVCNKGEKEYYRITLDSCGYREKRRKTLEELAVKISKSVIRTGRSTALEPMNPYERRIIHSKVSEIEGVSSKSVGEEPYRKVIISSTSGDRKGGKRRDNDFRRRKRRNTPPRSLDLKTSFEKDYKKPKPEDDMNAGLYGKIEF